MYRLLRSLDRLIDGISMYRLLLYYLIVLLALAAGLSAVGLMHYDPLLIGVCSLILVMACWLINKAFAYFFYAPVNPESSLLTGLILALIISPTLANFGILFLLAAAGLSMGSKYILNIKGKHIFNPAAIAVVLTSLGPHQSASWWVGTAPMLPAVLIGGLLIMRKTRREYMVGSFFIATTLATAIMAIIDKSNLANSMHNMVFDSAIFFLGFVMLTEPYTSPTTSQKQISYAILVGILVAPEVHLGHYYTSPEFGLIIGNIFAYIFSSRTKLFPVFKGKTLIAKNTFDFAFIPDRKLAYLPGQYMEWTLPHHYTDARGARRWFTLASSPTEQYLHLGVKFSEKGSSYKAAMKNIRNDSELVAAQVAGDFVMPKDTTRKLVFIAGGIGITPFRSMIKYMLDTGQKRSVRLLYSARTEADFAYTDILEAARQQLAISTRYLVTDPGAAISQAYTTAGTIDAGLITDLIPDYSQCIFYISGTHSMVTDLKQILHELGLHKKQIKTDFFPGYV